MQDSVFDMLITSDFAWPMQTWANANGWEGKPLTPQSATRFIMNLYNSVKGNDVVSVVTLGTQPMLTP